MKQLYFSLLTIFALTFANGQSYEFALLNNYGYNFSVVAIPNFVGTDTDISDVGFSLMLPAGNADVANLGMSNGRVWSQTEVIATQLTDIGLGDGSRDLFLLNMPPGQTIPSNGSGEQIALVSFDIINMPTSGEISILPNLDPIAIGLGSAADSFYNSNIDNTSTQDYFGGIAVGQGSFMFDNLSSEDVEFTDELSINPNPTKGKVTIHTAVNLDKTEIYDITGKLVGTYLANTIDISDFNSGVYILKIYSESGTTTKRLLRE